MKREMIQKYADLLITNLNLQEGQNLYIRTPPCQYDIAVIIAEQAYKKGAQYVEIDAHDMEKAELFKARADHSRDEYLDYMPEHKKFMWKKFVEDRWALLALKSVADPDLLSTCDATRTSRLIKAFTEARKDFSRATGNNQIQWLVAFMPSPKEAAKILGTEASQEAVDKVWQAMEKILYLDKENPAQFWIEKAKAIKKRAAKLNKLNLKAVRFRGPNTDLYIGLSDKSQWKGGPDLTSYGVTFSPNIPTEEVFTSPDCKLTNGTVEITRPVLVPAVGRIVNGAWLTFENGKVVDYDAKEGKDVLDQYFAIEDSARFLGEVALVDSNSPIFQSNMIFYNILFDENASSHIALGSAYPGCFVGGEKMNEEELKAIGGNRCQVHTDFMIGGPDIDVEGLTTEGQTVDIIKDGVFCI